ncbi:MAG: FHA domain-containing protein [Myxococcales bacterium]|nr:FHA domain-containing protein [Myxococcales bacterium]
MAVLRIHSPVVGRHEQVFEWDLRPITLGRDEACEVVLLEQAASRQHARLEWVDGEARLTDCGSANGVWVGNERIESRSLRDGESFRIGETTVQLVVDPFRQPTLVSTTDPAAPANLEDDLATGDTVYSETGGASRAPRHEPASSAEAATNAVAAPAPSPAPTPSDAPSPSSVPAPSAAPAPSPAPVFFAPSSSPSAYSLGEAPTLAGSSSSRSVYSLGNQPGGASREPDELGAVASSAPSVYSLGDETGMPTREPDELGAVASSAPSVYSLGSEPGIPSREPDSLGLVASSAPSVYSLGSEPGIPSREPDSLGLAAPSAPSVYSFGDQLPPMAARGPDSPGLPSSSSQLGTPPPAPVGPAGPAPMPAPMAPLATAPSPAPMAPAAAAPSPAPMSAAMLAPSPAPRAPASAASSWEWNNAPRRSEPRPHGHAAGPTLWVGVVLLIGGIVAIIAALAVGYEPSELRSLLGMAAR